MSVISDSIIDFGPVLKTSSPTALIGTITQHSRPIGAFRTDVFAEGADGVVQCFVFAADGRVVGQAALEPRIGSNADLLQEPSSARAIPALPPSSPTSSVSNVDPSARAVVLSLDEKSQIQAGTVECDRARYLDDMDWRSACASRYIRRCYSHVAGLLAEAPFRILLRR